MSREREQPPEPGLAWEQLADGRGADGSSERTFRARLPPDYGYFRGHFPGEPVLAGVVQLHELVLPCVRRARPGLDSPTRLTGLKFLLRIRPGDELDVVLRWRDARGGVEFEILCGGERCSTGTLIFGSDDGQASP